MEVKRTHFEPVRPLHQLTLLPLLLDFLLFLRRLFSKNRTGSVSAFCERESSKERRTLPSESISSSTLGSPFSSR